MVINIVKITKRRIIRGEDVIDLGGPLPRPPGTSRRTSSSYTPNPRLYPGPQTKSKVKKRTEAGVGGGDKSRGGGRARRRKRAVRRAAAVAPNPRLYRAVPRAPPRPPPPPARPRAAWAPPAQHLSLDTASRVALRVAEQRAGAGASSRRALDTPPSPSRSSLSLSSGAARATRARPPSAPVVWGASGGGRARNPRLVVTLPGEPAEAGAAPRYRPQSQHFRLRSLDTDSGASTPPPAARRVPAAAAPPPPPAMAASSASLSQDATPEDGSDGNDSSAPSEFLAEFLSAIMQRQYAEALKYCRLILQYEPHNATARGFYPLLQQKLGLRHGRASASAGTGAGAGAGSSDASSSAGAGAAERDASDAESCASLSLSLDSSAHSSRSASPPAQHTHSSESGRSACSEGSETRWTSSGSPPTTGASRSDPDDNGNPQPTHTAPDADLDLENDNAAGGDHTHLLKGSSLQQLRAQFACSTK